MMYLVCQFAFEAKCEASLNAALCLQANRKNVDAVVTSTFSMPPGANDPLKEVSLLFKLNIKDFIECNVRF